MGTSVVEQQPASPVGLFGGTFDPIHLGHLRMAEEVCDAFALSQIRLIPAAIPPHRPEPLLDATTRLRLVREAVADNPRLVVDDCEHTRCGKSYSADTINALRQQWPQTGMVMVLGMDAFDGFPDWVRPEEILNAVHIVVVTRPDYHPGAAAKALLAEREVNLATLASRLRAQPGQGGAIACLPTTGLSISATQLRGLIEQQRSIRYLVPDRVYRHFSDHSLREQ